MECLACLIITARAKNASMPFRIKETPDCCGWFNVSSDRYGRLAGIFISGLDLGLILSGKEAHPVIRRENRIKIKKVLDKTGLNIRCKIMLF
jgi:hypothetical protein